jgi:hypothetical protein
MHAKAVTTPPTVSMELNRSGVKGSGSGTASLLLALDTLADLSDRVASLARRSGRACDAAAAVHLATATTALWRAAEALAVGCEVPHGR